MHVYLSAFLALTIAVLGFPSQGLTDYVFTTAILDGPSSAPPNNSSGTGTAQVTLDTVAHILSVKVTFNGLTGLTTVAHIHAATALPQQGTIGIATQTPSFEGFPAGVTSGLYERTFDTQLASTWRPAFITENGGTPLGAEAALFAALTTKRAYFNIHTQEYPGGEIRGFLVAPVPASILLFGTGMLLLGARRLRRKTS